MANEEKKIEMNLCKSLPCKIDLVHTLVDHMTLVRIMFIWLVTCFRVRISEMYSIISRACSVVSNHSIQNLYFLIIEGGVGIFIFMIDVLVASESILTFDTICQLYPDYNAYSSLSSPN